MNDCPKSPTRRHEAHVTIPVICRHCRDLLPRQQPFVYQFDPRREFPQGVDLRFRQRVDEANV